MITPCGRGDDPAVEIARAKSLFLFGALLALWRAATDPSGRLVPA